MKSKVIWALLALNVSLVLLFVLRGSAESPAFAQMGRPGDYLLIPGEVIGGTDAVVYVLDQTSRQLSAMVYDDSTKRVQSMAPVNLDRVFLAPSAGGNPRPRPNR